MIKLKADKYISEENITIFRRKITHHIKCHTHDFFELSYILNGNGSQIINEREYLVARGDLLLFNIGVTHEVIPNQNLNVVNILINPSFICEELTGSYDALDLLRLTSFDDFKHHIENKLPLINFTGKSLVDLEQLIINMCTEFKNKEVGYKTMLRSLIHILFTMIFRHMKKGKEAELKKGIFYLAPQILKYIDENYNSKITLNDLARESFYNPSYFGQLFKECFGQTPTEFINNKRIQEAMRMLVIKNSSVENISNLVGFNDIKQFYMLFKDYTGMTPTEFRNHSRNNPEITRNSPL